MKRFLHLLLGLVLAAGALSAQAQRSFNQAELDALLAPIALYPDPLLRHVLNASVYPQDVAAAAAWSRANPQLQGDAALATVEYELWHPSVKALVAYPDVLARMAESPQWLADLGEAYMGMAPYVDATVQQLRARAAASGNLRSDDYQYVYQQGPTIVVQPVYPHIAYAPYYDPFVVYGTWWWPAYRPVYFRPWRPHAVVVTRIVHPVVVRPARPVRVTPWHPVPESRRMPIVQSAPTHDWGVGRRVERAAFPHSMPAARQYSPEVPRAPRASAPRESAPRTSAPRASAPRETARGQGGGGRWLSGRLQ